VSSRERSSPRAGPEDGIAGTRSARGFLLLVGSLAFACSAPRHGSPSQAYGASLGLRTDTAHDNGWSRDADLLHVELDLVLDPARQAVSGRVRHRFAALVAGTQAIRLHAEGLEILSAHDGEGHELAFELREPWLSITLASPLARGEEVELAVDYRAVPRRGLHFSTVSGEKRVTAPLVWSQGEPEEHHHWFPTWDSPNERASCAANLRVGGDLTALSNGLLVGVDDHGGGEHTFHWRLDQEIPTYLVAIAAGRFERYTDDWRGIPVEYWVAEGTGEERARRAFGETPAMLDYFSELLDYPYPFPRYAQVAVHGFEWGGMENATLTILNDYVLDDPEAIADREGDDRLLVAHELAHHWFGDLVTCFSWSSLWLNEAWASYLELCYEGHVSGSVSEQMWLERYREAYLAADDGRSPLSRDFWSQGGSMPGEEERASHLYDKGPWALYMLERELGSDVFWQGVRHYLRAHEWDLVDTHDFTRAMFDSTGRNVESWAEQWIECAGHPVFEVRFDEGQTEAGARAVVLHVAQPRSPEPLVPLFDVMVDVDLVYDDGRRERHALRVHEREEDFVLPLTGTLADVLFDASADLLCEIRLEKSVAMWARQARLEAEPVLQWRAIDALRAAIDGDASGEAEVALLTLARRSPQVLLRERAVSACDFAGAVGHLVEIVESDPAPGVRHAAVEALSKLRRSPEQEQRLREHESHETSPMVRAAIGELFGDAR
jgi:aminopeptidase N